MPKLRPLILIGIGPQARQTVKYTIQTVSTRRGEIPAVLPVSLDFVPGTAPFRRASEGIEHLTLVSPVFEAGARWPTWLPAGLAELTLTQRERTRAWMHAALLQKADEWQEFLLESIPGMSSLVAVEAMQDLGVTLTGDSEIDIYVIADLNDPLGSGVFVDVAYLTAYVCRQLGFLPHVNGVLYLPGATSPAPAEEALAYAALKELESYMHGRHDTHGLMPDWAPADGQPPFTDGCYLVDDVNEMGYTLAGEAQKTAAVGEWLYAMTMLGMQETVNGLRSGRFQRGTLRGRSRAYESMGVITGYVPLRLLQTWGAALLGRRVLDRLLAAPSDDTRAERDARAFIEQHGLRVDALSSRLRHHTELQPIDEVLGAIDRGALSLAETRARQALQTMREQHLPALDQNLGRSVEQAKQEIRSLIQDESRFILQDNVPGTVRRALQWGQELQKLIAAQREEADRLSAGYQVELKQSLTTVSQSHYGLRSVRMSTPPWPIAAWSLIALVLMPLLYLIGLIGRTIWAVDPVWAILAWTLLAVGILIVSGFVFLHQRRQRQLVYEQHRRMVRERFELESKPLLIRALRDTYNSAHEAATSIQAEIQALTVALESAAAALGEQVREHESRLNALSTPGPFRALVDVTRARHHLAHLLNTERLYEWLASPVSSVAEWQAECTAAPHTFGDSLCQRLLQDASRYLEPHLQSWSALHALEQDTADHASRDLERMFGGAHPLWNYDPAVLGRAKTQRLAFFGVDTSTSAWARIVGPLSQICADVIPVNTGDPFAVVAMRVHSGVPLFALRRIGEYRTHYAEMLWRSKLPLHATGDLSLVDDLIPARRRPRLPVAALFTAGLALGVICRDADGRYLAPRSGDETIRLSADKERAAALMSLDPLACLEMQHRLDAWVARKGKTALRRCLDQYAAAAAALEDWELGQVLTLQAAYHLEDNHHEPNHQEVHVAQTKEVNSAS